MSTYTDLAAANAAIEQRDRKIAALTSQLEQHRQLQGKTAVFIETAHADLRQAHAHKVAFDAFNAKFREGAAKLAGLLDARALIPPSRTGELVDQLAQDPLQIFDVCTKIAAQVPAVDVGEPAGAFKGASAESLTGFEQLAVEANPSLLRNVGGGSNPNLYEQSGR